MTKLLTVGEDTTFSKAEISEAFMFLNSLKLDATLRSRWVKVLATAKEDKAKPEEKIKCLDKFLADNNFDVGANVVLYMLRTPWWMSYIKNSKPNKASDQFVQQILQDPKLFIKWTKVVSRSAAEATQLLEALDYRCNLQQVAASFSAMRDQVLAFWSGIYGRVSLIDIHGNKVDKDLTLIIYKGHVSLGPDTIFGWSYKNGDLTWPLGGDDMPFPNKCSGAITFSEIIHPREEGGYVGHIFSGILDYSDSLQGDNKAYSYGGQIGEAAGAVPYGFKPGSAEEKAEAKREKRADINYILGLLVGVCLIIGTMLPMTVNFVRWGINKRNNGKGGKGGGKESDKSKDVNKLKASDAKEIDKSTLKAFNKLEPIFPEFDIEGQIEELARRHKSLGGNTNLKDVLNEEAPISFIEGKTYLQKALQKAEKELGDTPTEEELANIEKIRLDLKLERSNLKLQRDKEEKSSIDEMDSLYDSTAELVIQ